VASVVDNILMAVDAIVLFWWGLLVEAVGEGWRRWLSWRRLLALVLVAVVLAAGVVWVVVPYVQELFKYERLALRDHWWTRNSAGDVSMVTLVLENNGTKTLTMSEVFVNGTMVDPTKWDCRYGKVYDPESWAWMYILPESTAFQEGGTYNFTVSTESGNGFSYTLRVGARVFEEKARIEDALFYPSYYSIYYGNIVWVEVGNIGPVPIIVVEGWWNGTQQNITKTWIFSGYSGDQALSVTFHLTWHTGETYNFTLRTVSGNTYNYTKTAPS
jgi:hypothetical protein